MKMQTPKESTFMLAILSFSVFLIKVVMNVLAGFGYIPFQQSVQNASDAFNLEITPAGWAFSIWGFIYIWNTAYMVYAFTTTVRDVPPVLNALFFLVYIVSDLLNVTWLYAFTSNSIGASCVVLLGNVVVLYLLSYVVYRNYSTYERELEDQYYADAICMRVLVQNGIMLNAAWVTIAFLLNIAMVFVYKLNLLMAHSCSLVLSLLLVILLFWFIIENFTFQGYLNYTYADWPVVLWALSAILAKNWDPVAVNSRFAMAILVITVLLLIARITLQVLRNKTYYHRPSVHEQFIHCTI